MQKGLATLEIICAIIIIGVLVKVAVPNAAQILDTAALDYETKKLYSDLRFVQEMNRSSTIVLTGTGNTNLLGNNGGEKITLFISSNENSWQIFREAGLNNSIREPHNLSYGVKVYSPIQKINFDSDGKANINSNHITLTSRLGKKRYIIFNSVGRMRSSLTPAND